MAKRGPKGPRIKINQRRLFNLAKIHCTMDEMASIMECSTDLLRKKYSEIIQKGRDHGKECLRRMQWNKAKEGNIVMMIWLGKQLLKQQDKAHIDLNSTEHKKISITKADIRKAIERDKFMNVVDTSAEPIQVKQIRERKLEERVLEQAQEKLKESDSKGE